MNRDELVESLLAERFGPLPTVLVERQSAAERRQRVLVAALRGPDWTGWLPPRVRPEIRADVAALAGRGWSVEQVAALLDVTVARVRHLMPAPDDDGVDEGGAA